MRDLSRGDRGKEVLDVQTRLRGQGFELGREGVDGFYGPTPRPPSSRSSSAATCSPTASWAPTPGASWSSPATRSATACCTCASRRSAATTCSQLQVKLNLLGFNAGPERGVHDEEVERAVLDFQRNAGLPPDGIVGESTLTKLEAVRKAESGREGKKIPERDRGYAAARGLTGQSVTIDPGHGGGDAGYVSATGVAEKDVTLALGLRLAELLRAEGCRVQLTREADARVPLYARADAANGAASTYFVSLHCNAGPSPEARRRRLLLPAQPLLLRARAPPRRLHRRPAWSPPGALAWAVRPQLRLPARDARHRAPDRAAVLTSPEDEALARRPEHIEQLARALVGGFADYLARVPAEG